MKLKGSWNQNMDNIVEFNFPYVDIYFENILKIQEDERKRNRAKLMNKILLIGSCLVLLLLLVLIKIKFDNAESNTTEYRVIQVMIQLSGFIYEMGISVLLTLLLVTIIDLIDFLMKNPFTKKRFIKVNKDKIIKMIRKDAGCYVNRSALVVNSKGLIIGINKDSISLKQYLEKCLKAEALGE